MNATVSVAVLGLADPNRLSGATGQLRLLIEGKDGPLETVEPLGGLLRRPRNDPEVQLLELGLDIFRDLNAVCHASGGGE